MATITKQKNGKYRIRVYAGYDINGKQIERSMVWQAPAGMSDRGAEKEAHRQAVLFEEKVHAIADCDGRIKFADFADIWFANYATPNLRPRTVFRYQQLLQRINLHLGHLPLEKIKPGHLMAFYKALEDERIPCTYKCNKNLDALMQIKCFTRRTLAEMSDVSVTTIGTALKKKAISRECAEKITNALKVPLERCFYPAEPPKGLSATTISHHHKLVSDILSSAVRWQYIQSNPTERIQPPRPDHPDISYLETEDALQFVSLLQKMDNPGYYRRPILVSLLTGLRRSELLGLEWKDINWAEKTLHVSRTAQVLPKQGVYTDKPKTRSSNRIVFLSDQVISILQEQRLWQQMQANLPGHIPQDNDRIFTKPDGEPMHPDRLTQWFRKFIKKNNLPQGLHLHSLRHSFASIAIANGAPIPDVSAQLGHASVTTTTNIYTHVIRSSQSNTAAQVGNLFNNLI